MVPPRMRDQPAALEAAIEVLRVQVETLQLEANHLRSELASAQQRLSFLEGRTLGTEVPPSSAPAASNLSSPVRLSTGAGYQVGVEREEACQDIGAWVRHFWSRARSSAEQVLFGFQKL